MKLVCISDTHMMHNRLEMPDGDVLIHAGDICNEGKLPEVRSFATWLDRQPYKHKIIIAGNHDWPFYRETERESAEALLNRAGAIYLRDSAVVIGGNVFYGSPWQPEFCNWAFNLPRGHQLREKWKMIYDNTDVLVTHGPPHGILDYVPRDERVGDADLLYRLGQISPKVHIFGHIHYSRGEHSEAGTHFINAAICNEAYAPAHKPITVELEEK